MKTGLIDVGGGLRGVYAAGVLDRCLDEDVRFDYGIGISAGSANLTSFLAGQRGRNLRFFRDYSQRKAYMGPGNFLRGRGFLDLQYIYGTLSVSGGEDPLDYPRIAADPTEWYVAATEAGTGKSHYFRPGDLHQDDYRILMASSAIPVVCPAQVIGGVPYYDGALGGALQPGRGPGPGLRPPGKAPDRGSGRHLRRPHPEPGPGRPAPPL